MTTWDRWNYNDPELSLLAQRWIDAHSGRETWRVVETAPLGFWYDGEGFYSPKFKPWNEMNP